MGLGDVYKRQTIHIVPGYNIITDRIGYHVRVRLVNIYIQTGTTVTCDRIVLYDRIGSINIEPIIITIGTVFNRVALYECFISPRYINGSTIYNIVFN